MGAFGYSSHADMKKFFTRQRRRLLIALILPVLVMRAFVPAGYMPGEHAGFGIALQFCGSPVPVAGGDPGTADSHAAQQCAFALGAVTGPLPAVAQLGSLVLFSATPVSSAALQCAADSVCPRSQSQRGPSALS